jgi:isopentenyl diphosphate isomerase/L-lactate dehydrogenase-like FMN-dependent dehydrogenase
MAKRYQLTLTDEMEELFSKGAEQNGMSIPMYVRTLAYKQAKAAEQVESMFSLVRGMSPEDLRQVTEAGLKEIRERSGSDEQH